MGFEYHLGSISKKKYEKIKSYTLDQLKLMVKDEESVSSFKVTNEFYSLGGDLNTESLKFYLKPVFTKSATHRYMSTGQSVFNILTKEGLKQIIDVYHDLNFKFTKETEDKINKLIEGTLDDYGKMKLQNEFKSKTQEWTDKTKLSFLPYNLDNPKTLINSWKYEYAIFELVYIYKTFDFNKNILTFTGH